MQRLSLRQPARTRVSAELTMRPILVATDFSDGAKRAVEAAAPVWDAQRRSRNRGSSIRLTASGEQRGLRMALLDVARSRIRDQSHTPRPVSAGKQQRNWRTATLEFFGALSVLIGVAMGRIAWPLS